MRIVGEWFDCLDGETRPVVEGFVADAAGHDHNERFLVDTGADRSVFTASLLRNLSLPTVSAPTGVGLAGVGGQAQYVLVRTTLTLYADDANPARIQGEFAAFTAAPDADMSILGRDVLNHFQVIVSRPTQEVLLLALNHRYRVERV
jgi:hypothetical protein